LSRKLGTKVCDAIDPAKKKIPLIRKSSTKPKITQTKPHYNSIILCFIAKRTSNIVVKDTNTLVVTLSYYIKKKPIILLKLDSK
jgi:hypothetical protein